MKKRAGLFIILLVVAAAAHAQAATLRGQLVWPDGQPANSVQVTLVAGGSTRGTVYTDAEGFFAMYNVPPGNYALQVKAGKQTQTFAITVTTPRTDLRPIRLR